jgi:hypothetical protein
MEEDDRVVKRKYTDSCYSWLITTMSFCILYAMSANIVAFGVFLPEFVTHFQKSQALLGLLGSIKLAVFDVCSGKPYFV